MQWTSCRVRAGQHGSLTIAAAARPSQAGRISSDRRLPGSATAAHQLHQSRSGSSVEHAVASAGFMSELRDASEGQLAMRFGEAAGFARTSLVGSSNHSHRMTNSSFSDTLTPRSLRSQRALLMEGRVMGSNARYRAWEADVCG